MPTTLLNILKKIIMITIIMIIDTKNHSTPDINQLIIKKNNHRLGNQLELEDKSGRLIFHQNTANYITTTQNMNPHTIEPKPSDTSKG